MSTSIPFGPDEPLRVGHLLEVLPRSVELRPLMELLISVSRADPDRRWSASGALGTVGERLVDPGAVAEAAPRAAESEARRLAELYRRTTRIVDALAAGREDDAIRAMVEQGGDDEEAGRAASARAWYGAAHVLGRVVGSRRAPEALRRAARCARTEGDLVGAARDYERAFEDTENLGLEDDAVVAAMGRGNVAVDRGRWDEAEAWYGRVLERVGPEGEPRRERWQALQNLAIVHRRRGEYDAARRALAAAGREGAALGDRDAEVEVENGWGQLLLAEGDARGAELHFRRALTAARSPKARVTVGVNLGEALLARGHTLEAGEVARQAEAAAVGARVTGKLPEVYRLLAAVSRERGEPEPFMLLERALEIVREDGLPRFEEALTLEAYGELRAGEDPGDAALRLAEAARIYRELGMDDRSEEARARAGRLVGAVDDRAGDAAAGPKSDVEEENEP